MANPSGVLRLIEGKVFLYNTSGQKALTYYTKGDATRADFMGDDGSIQVQLSNGKVILINKSCQIYKIFN